MCGTPFVGTTSNGSFNICLNYNDAWSLFYEKYVVENICHKGVLIYSISLRVRGVAWHPTS